MFESNQTEPRSPRWRKRWIALVSAFVAVLAAVSLARAENVGFFGGRDSAETAPATATPAGTSGSPSPSANNIVITDDKGDHRNVVVVSNHHDGTFRARGRIDLNKIHGPSTAPLNEAEAFSQCTDCQSLAVAMQVNLISSSATSIQPHNFAVAVNYQCQTCATVALAFQFNMTVADPDSIPPRVNQMVKDMSKELNGLHNRHITVDAAVAEVQQVISQYNDLTQFLEQLKRESTSATDPGATPVPEDTPAPSPSAEVTVSPSSTPAASPQPSESATPAGSASP